MGVHQRMTVDRELVLAAQHGDQVAFMDLVRARLDHLFAIARRILHDVDRAEDALQDALVIAWRDLRDLRDPDRFDFWIASRACRTCASTTPRRERRRTAHLRMLDRSTDHAAPDDLVSVANRDLSSNARSDGFRPNSGRSLFSTITSGTRPLRSPRPSTSRPVPRDPDSITPIAPCAPPSTQMLEPPSGKVDRHDSRSRPRTAPWPVAWRRTNRRPGPGHRRRR